MLSHEEMIGLQAEHHEIVDEDDLPTADQYVLHLMHSAAYRHAARVVEGKSVLDLGCNTGYGSNILSVPAKSVVGVDVSERAVTLAQQKYVGANIEFQVIDGTRIPFEDDSFDIVTCFQLIEHLVEYDGFISELKRVLRTDGIVIFTTPNALLRLDPGMKPWNKFHVREFNPEELENTLADYFQQVCVLALYACEPVYQLVANRADRLRRKARAKASGGPAGPSTKDLMPSLQFVKDNHSPEDFFYQMGGLDSALEFMAICSGGDIAPYIDLLADDVSRVESLK